MVQIHPDPPLIGGVAQLGERLLCKQEVIGSIPFTSTSNLLAAVVTVSFTMPEEECRTKRLRLVLVFLTSRLY